MRITQTEDGRPVVIVTGEDLQIFIDALRGYVASGAASRRAVTLLGALAAVESSNRVEPCVCGSRAHRTSDCPERPGRRLRLL
ncbi:hypothetical protein ACFRCI_03555 [Streptomyces sp. NPDC056638]|uniref:hypothetical protein n=1 Tax=Streptomyces sp. NPDC056638 TaxID=3345887 RepID=UPI0036C0596A